MSTAASRTRPRATSSRPGSISLPRCPARPAILPPPRQPLRPRARGWPRYRVQWPAPRSGPRFSMPSRPSESAERGPRVALVIGNAAYANVGMLADPVNDAREMSSALRELGFKVIEGYNLTSATMRSKIAEFGNALPGAGVSLFYYAGHGMQVSGRNYLVPVDAR